jgi:cyclic pyranopterin phosphate synthase
MVKLVDVTVKPVIFRRATAIGEIKLKQSTVNAIKRNRIKKGNPLNTARIAAILAAKNTATIIPLCHQISLTDINIDFKFKRNNIKCTATVTASAKTGVELEALVCVSTALLTIWDMVKYLEKDAEGQYPVTAIKNIIVQKKVKEDVKS